VTPTSDHPPNPPAATTGAGLFFAEAIHGGLIFNAELARKIAEHLCEAHHGAEELTLQKPLSVADKGTYWRVEGSRNRDGKVEGIGAFFASIEKSDGRVTDFGLWYRYQPHPSVVPILQEHFRRKKPDTTE
jgi:NTF2 fold immunity protein